jgi:membrane protease YdiL (CAAX protease family)
MDAVVMVVGLVAEAVAWWMVAFRRADIWRVVTPVLAALGIASLIVGPPPWSPDVSSSVALAVGVVTGIALYIATRLFFAIVGGWRPLREQSIAMYRKQGTLSLPIVLVLSLAVSVPGEELFWRGLFQLQLTDAVNGAALGAVIGWAGFVLANTASWNLAIIAGAVVGGAAWAGLCWWCGGVAAPLACHLVWTGLMLVLPVVRVPPEAP